jgi:hypothetical protein
VAKKEIFEAQTPQDAQKDALAAKEIDHLVLVFGIDARLATGTWRSLASKPRSEKQP